MRRALVSAMALAATASVGCGAAARARATCAGAGSCGEARSCLIGACRPADAEIVPPQARRVVLPATQIVVICGSETVRIDAGAVGARAQASSCRHPTMLLRFDVPWGPDARIAAAFLVLAPAAGAPSLGAESALDVAPVLERWSASTVAWRPPATGRTAGRALAVTQRLAVGPLRIEVTPMVVSWARRTLDDNGVALTADIGPESTILMATASGAANAGPTLDVYLR